MLHIYMTIMLIPTTYAELRGPDENNSWRRAVTRSLRLRRYDAKCAVAHLDILDAVHILALAPFMFAEQATRCSFINT